MPKRNTLLIAIFAVVLAVVLLLPSFTTRAIFAAALLLACVLLIIRLLSTKPSDVLEDSLDAEPDSEESNEEIFARGKLFEATMNGMREGLLVVDRDMRVVASNIAARGVFNLSREKLDAQRL
ncbi:MAG TPA: PAS domain-containing protein, partial [Pyrinomonadaceae bacterium]|nr:PAS domain-containing protein [Pyrinomonadaceae bacterium]